MSNFTFKLDRAGVRQLLKSEQMKKICEEYAKAAQARCGEGYVVTSHTGRNRANASLYAETVEAKVDNSKNNTLLKAVK